MTKGTPSEPARQLIEFARSAEVRDLVEQQSFVRWTADRVLGGLLGGLAVLSALVVIAIFGLVAAEAAPSSPGWGRCASSRIPAGSRRQRASTSARCSGARC
ncbi:MAG: hypothetical protein R3F60_09115 [bacterium]